MVLNMNQKMFLVKLHEAKEFEGRKTISWSYHCPCLRHKMIYIGKRLVSIPKIPKKLIPKIVKIYLTKIYGKENEFLETLIVNR